MDSAKTAKPHDSRFVGAPDRPWYYGSFMTPRGEYQFTFNSDGHGLLTTPEGKTGRIVFRRAVVDER
jgi:hypothetical protein